MRQTRKCEFCGKTFVPRSGMKKYCSEECQAEAKRHGKKRQQDLVYGIEPIMDLRHQEYLTFSTAAILMGCTRQYIYKLMANGKLKASRLGSRMAFVRKTYIEKMFEGNPYKRVISTSKSKHILICEWYEVLYSFAKTRRINFNDKKSASIYYGIMVAVKYHIGFKSLYIIGGKEVLV